MCPLALRKGREISRNLPETLPTLRGSLFFFASKFEGPRKELVRHNLHGLSQVQRGLVCGNGDTHQHVTGG